MNYANILTNYDKSCLINNNPNDGIKNTKAGKLVQEVAEETKEGLKKKVQGTMETVEVITSTTKAIYEGKELIYLVSKDSINDVLTVLTSPTSFNVKLMHFVATSVASVANITSMVGQVSNKKEPGKQDVGVSANLDEVSWNRNDWAVKIFSRV